MGHKASSRGAHSSFTKGSWVPLPALPLPDCGLAEVTCTLGDSVSPVLQRASVMGGKDPPRPVRELHM